MTDTNNNKNNGWISQIVIPIIVAGITSFGSVFYYSQYYIETETHLIFVRAFTDIAQQEDNGKRRQGICFLTALPSFQMADKEYIRKKLYKC